MAATKNAWLDQRIRISGSEGADGEYPGVPGTTIEVRSDHWQLGMDWRDPNGGTWQPSRIRRLGTYTSTDGLVLTLGADDSPRAVGDADFNDMTVTARYLDRFDPPTATGELYDFSVTEGMIIAHDDDREPSPPLFSYRA